MVFPPEKDNFATRKPDKLFIFAERQLMYKVFKIYYTRKKRPQALRTKQSLFELPQHISFGSSDLSVGIDLAKQTLP